MANVNFQHHYSCFQCHMILHHSDMLICSSRVWLKLFVLLNILFGILYGSLINR